MTLARGTGAVLLILSLGACDRPSNTIGPLLRDSAGIQIVNNGAPRWRPTEEWFVDSLRAVVIGRGENLYAVAGAAEFGARILVANQGDMTLRVYALDGHLLSSSGRMGNGPGEFQAMSAPIPLGRDSLVVYDMRLHRISVIGPDATVTRVVQLPPEPTRVVTGAPLPGLGVVAAEPLCVPGRETSPDSAAVALIQPDGTLETVLWAHVPGCPAVRTVLSPQFRIAGGATGIFVGTGETYEIRQRAGDLTRITRREHHDRPIDREVLRQFMHDYVSMVVLIDGPLTTEGRQRIEMNLRSANHPQKLPAYADLLVDTDGHLWAKEYIWPYSRASADWSVFDAEGVWLGDVRVPGMWVTYIGSDRVVGIRRDADGTELVMAYPLQKPLLN